MPAPERRAREKDLRQQRIIAAARQLAEDEGWDAVTTRRLADAIEYTQPVLYGHFQNKDAIIAAVAVQGFAELAAAMGAARRRGRTAQAALLAVARAYLAFAEANPALYEAMFSLADLPFARPERPDALGDGFTELAQALAPFAGDRDLETLCEITWSALHGLAALTGRGRLRPGHDRQRLTLLIGELTNDAGAGQLR
jgi:AcrR family transcriptional regulator